MDFYDRAQETEALFRDKALETFAAKNKLQAGAGALHCIDCGEAIPSARRAAVPGVQTCMECQTAREKQQRMRGAD